MGKRTHRWNPPHKRPEQLQVQDPRLDARNPESWMCLWPECLDHGAIWLGWRMCEKHGREIHEMVQRHDCPPIVRESIERRERAHEDNSSKINAGERVDTARRDLIPGWVYYVLIDGLIKIGYAKSVPARMRAYPPTAQLLAVEPGTLQVERARHQHFGHHLAKGREWFADTPDLRAWIDTVVTEYGTADDFQARWGREEKRPTVAGKRQRRGYAI